MDSASDRLLPPRVLGEFGPMPLFEVLSDLLSQNRYTAVVLEGAGCTSALRCVQTWADEAGLSVATTDGWWVPSESAAPAQLQVMANYKSHVGTALRLCDWGRDEFIDYLLAYHPSECKRVMASLQHIDTHFADGSPFVWQPYLEWLATHHEMIEPAEFVLNELILEFSNRLAMIADQMLVPGGQERQYGSRRVERWLGLADVRQYLMAQRLAEHIRSQTTMMLERRWPSDLISTTARAIKSQCEALPTDAEDGSSELSRLIEFLQGATDDNLYSQTAVSLLSRMADNWKPQLQRSVDLSFSDFRRAKWAGCSLRAANLMSVKLSEADLSGADLSRTQLHHASFQQAVMKGTQLNRAMGQRVKFTDADLSNADLNHCRFDESDFSRACMSECDLSHGQLDAVDMQRVNLRRANCNNARLVAVNFKGAHLEAASFRVASFERVNFKEASLRGASFEEAEFETGIDLEELDLSDCIFTGAKLHGAYLTDSTARYASFKLADLSQAGLAGVVWENCDLRGVDLRGAAFHMGSTRCGLVDSPYPSHGTRTGFYTDDYVDLSYKQPEQVRKAALVGCDLRGAILYGCDFYLVDVRDCQLDPDQRELMASCGAILE